MKKIDLKNRKTLLSLFAGIFAVSLLVWSGFLCGACGNNNGASGSNLVVKNSVYGLGYMMTMGNNLIMNNKIINIGDTVDIADVNHAFFCNSVAKENLRTYHMDSVKVVVDEDDAGKTNLTLNIYTPLSSFIHCFRIVNGYAEYTKKILEPKNDESTVYSVKDIYNNIFAINVKFVNAAG